jgi:CheY-like chemotaxis protein
VLVVEDNHDCAEVVGAFLEALGHEVHVAFDGPRGPKELARQVKPDTI